MNCEWHESSIFSYCRVQKAFRPTTKPMKPAVEPSKPSTNTLSSCKKAWTESQCNNTPKEMNCEWHKSKVFDFCREKKTEKESSNPKVKRVKECKSAWVKDQCEGQPATMHCKWVE